MKLATSFITLVLALSSTVHGLLDEKIRAKGKQYFGAALDAGLLNDDNVRTIASADFGQITHENSLKWEVTEPERDQFNFDLADQVVDFAVSTNRLIRGHTLVWHSQLPAWVEEITDPQTLIEVITNHISVVMGRYRGQFFQWDVVNEVFEEDGSFRQSVFFRLLGEEFIDLAFQQAKLADPTAKLYINDFNLDFPGPKIDAMLALLGRLQARGVPIDGIGTQSHLIVGQVASVPEQLERLAATGLDLAITELDIRLPSDSLTPADFQAQADDYVTVIGKCLEIQNCVGVTVWGVSDRDSWVDFTFAGFDSPLLFDDFFNRKTAYAAVDRLLS